MILIFYLSLGNQVILYQRYAAGDHFRANANTPSSRKAASSSGTSLSLPLARKTCTPFFIKIISQVCQSSSFDIYHSIATVCPTQADIKEISNDEVASRIHLFNNFSSPHLRSFSKYNHSPGVEENEPEKLEDHEPHLEGFCTFSQPSIRNFLDEV